MFKLIINNSKNKRIKCLNSSINIIRSFCTTTTTTTSSSSSTQSPNLYDIIIIGGGLVGTTMACSLGSNKSTSHLKVALIESSPIQSLQETLVSPIPDIRTISFNNQTIQLFKSIGVWDKIKSTNRVNPFNKVRVWDTSGFGGIDFDDRQSSTDPMGYIIENKIVTSSLFEKLKEFPNIDIFSEQSVSSIENYDQSTKILPSVRLSNGDQPQQLHAKLIIGADGGNSILKKQLQVPSMGKNYNQKAIVCTIKLGGKDSDNNTLFQRFLPTGPIALLPLANGYANIIWSTNLLHAKYLLELDDQSFLESIQNSFLKSPQTSNGDSLIEFVSSVINPNPMGLSGNEIYLPPISNLVSKRASFPLRIDHTFNYTLPRLCFIGDASHIVHPMAGQGVNLGMADVKSLSSMIEQSIHSGYDIGDAMMLKRFEENRKPENMKMMLSIDTLYNLFTNNSIAITAFRNFGMSFLNNIPILKNYIVSISKGG